MIYKTPNQIEALTGTKIIPMQYENLKAHITQYVGINKKYDGIVKENYPRRNSPAATLLTLSPTTKILTATMQTTYPDSNLGKPFPTPN